MKAKFGASKMSFKASQDLTISTMLNASKMYTRGAEIGDEDDVLIKEYGLGGMTETDSFAISHQSDLSSSDDDDESD